jgi:hypothetical protein
VKVSFAFTRKEAKLLDHIKWLKETYLEVGLVSSSSFLNGDVGITVVWFRTSKNKYSSHLFSLPSFLFCSSHLCFRLDLLWCAYLCIETCIYRGTSLGATPLVLV